MMKNRALGLIATLLVLVPAAVGAQQDPLAIAEGAQVYANNCARCHQARPGSERTDLEWIAIVAHMRARANFTKSQAAAVLAFLQATNLPETGAGMAAAAGTTTVIPESLREALEEAITLADSSTTAVGTPSSDPERTPRGRGG